MSVTAIIYLQVNTLMFLCVKSVSEMDDKINHTFKTRN